MPPPLRRGRLVTACGDALERRPEPDPPTELLRAALWQAARHGLTGELVDLGPAGMRSPVMRLAAEVLEGLFTAVEPPLRAAGDADQARDGVAAALRCGGGGRQRAVFTGGGIPALLGLLQAATIAA